MSIYQNKTKSYFSSSREDLITLIPQNQNNKILEIGAGSGDTLIRIKELGLASEVIGFDLFKIPDTQQENKLIDKFIIGNIETISLEYPENYFDVIICGDVLEHLIDPWKVVEKLSKHLKPNGKFIASVPNIREITTLLRIIFKGDFKYEKEGILDQTHLRFFCKKNIKALFPKENFTVDSIMPSFDKNKQQKNRRIVNNITFGFIEEFLAIQFIIIANKR